MALPAINLDAHEKGKAALDLLTIAATWDHLREDAKVKLADIFQTLADYYFLLAPRKYRHTLNDWIKTNSRRFRHLMCNDIRLILSKDCSFVEKSLILVQMRHFADKLEKVYTKKIDAQEKFALRIDTPEGSLQFLNYLLTYTNWRKEYLPVMEKILSDLPLFYLHKANTQQRGVIQGLVFDHYQRIKKILPYDSKLTVTLGETLSLDVQTLVLKSFHILDTRFREYIIDEVTDLIPILHLMLENELIRNSYRNKIDALLLLISNYYFTEARPYDRTQIRIFISFLKKNKHLERLNKTVKRFYIDGKNYHVEAPLLLTHYPTLSHEISRKNIQERYFQVQNIVSIFEMYIHLTGQPHDISYFFPAFRAVSDYYFTKAPKDVREKIQEACFLHAKRLNGKVPEDIRIKVPSFQHKTTFVTFPFNRLLLILSPDLAPLSQKSSVVEINDSQLLHKIITEFKKRGIDFPLPPQVALGPQRK